MLAHDNPFNRWVAGSGARYFRDATGLDLALTETLASPEKMARMASLSKERFWAAFTWQSVLYRYEKLLTSMLREANASKQVPSQQEWRR